MASFPGAVLRPNLGDILRDRWNVPDWERDFTWWRPPAECRILIYTDSTIMLQGGSFQGLTYVKTLLETHAYFYVDFKVDVCNRDGFDPSATVSPGTPKKLTDLDIINKYDQIWFFGITGGNGNLTPGELTLLDQFMAAPKFGGVLTTGDHANLGQGLCGQIRRVKQMRQYPAPPNSPYDWNTTIVQRPPVMGEPADPDPPADFFNFDDQSDDIPQTIRWRRYRTGIFYSRPHPVLCGPDGPINYLPDHQHEGEALAPSVGGNADWPTGAGGQEPPQVIAWGRIKDPTATKHGQEIGVISAYNGHMVDVGRILADSTWHHWFDINLMGLSGSPAPYTGFGSTAAGQAALKQIDAYFLNVGVWLAPPSVQSAMRQAAWWSIVWQDIIVELTPDTPLRILGRYGLDALGRRASRCAVFDWVLPKEPIYKPKIPWWEWRMWPPELIYTDVPIEQYVAGGIVRELITSFGLHSKRSIKEGPPAAKELDAALAKGTDAGVAALTEDLKRETGLVSKLIEGGFSTKRIRG
ncbi:hypothetical protein [Sphingomonas sp.]|uniref:hypothetical protein n=1 Tax=Sphingomonas sp. TaxID=28214 RepID=UPI001B152B1E|nr:hypothetical protein [Sphingomonas sp.]MBO9712738.1 hypothetical protein [Sphingomonas sp.]